MGYRRSAAWPLSCVYAALVVYASLYPFDGWRIQGIAPWSFLTSPLPKYWTGFDVASNVLGYAPLGFLGCLAVLRQRPGWPALWLVTLAAMLLSLLMESLQMFLPMRVPSNVDLALNTLGALAGALVARVLAACVWWRTGAAGATGGLWAMPAGPWSCCCSGPWPCCSRCRCPSAWARCSSAWRRRWPAPSKAPP